MWRYTVQYMRLKQRKQTGKTTREYLSMSPVEENSYLSKDTNISEHPVLPGQTPNKVLELGINGTLSALRLGADDCCCTAVVASATRSTTTGRPGCCCCCCWRWCCWWCWWWCSPSSGSLEQQEGLGCTRFACCRSGGRAVADAEAAAAAAAAALALIVLLSWAALAALKAILLPR